MASEKHRNPAGEEASGTVAYEATGNLAMVMNLMGHTDVLNALPDPALDSVREAIDQRNLGAIHGTTKSGCSKNGCK
jgi:hypothetical protein